jgi:hypothetical protein
MVIIWSEILIKSTLSALVYTIIDRFPKIAFNKLFGTKSFAQLKLSHQIIKFTMEKISWLDQDTSPDNQIAGHVC